MPIRAAPGLMARSISTPVSGRSVLVILPGAAGSYGAFGKVRQAVRTYPLGDRCCTASFGIIQIGCCRSTQQSVEPEVGSVGYGLRMGGSSVEIRSLRQPHGRHFRFCYVYDGWHCSCGGDYSGHYEGPVVVLPPSPFALCGPDVEAPQG